MRPGLAGQQGLGAVGGALVVIQQAPDGGFAFGGRILCPRQGPGMFPDQVVEPVPAASRLGDQVLVAESLQQALGVIRAGTGEGGGRPCVDVAAQVQAQPTEHALLGIAQVLIGEVEGGGDRHAFGVHLRQPVTGQGQVGRQIGRGPGRAVAQPAAEDPQGQRQVPAQRGDLGHRRVLGVKARPRGEPYQQPCCLIGVEDLEPDGMRVFERRELLAAGDQDQAARRARQQRPDLLAASRVVQQQ